MASVFTPAQLAATKAPSIYAAAISTFALASIAVPLRIIARRLSGANLWWDDWFIFIAYFFACGVFATTILWLKEGVGKHVEAVLADNPKGLTIILKSITPAEMSYTLAILFAKYSILAFYSRIFKVSNMRKILIVLAVIVTAWAISVIVVSSVTCVPLAALWDPTIHGKCVDLPKFYLGIAIPNVITDWVMLIVPLHFIWKLQMPRSQKVVVTGLFIVGSFVCVVSLVRLVFIAHIDLVDITWGLVNLDLWTCVECFSAVLCACLPSLKPIYNLVLGKPIGGSKGSSVPSPYVKSSTNRSKTMWNSSNSGANKPESFTRLNDNEEWAPGSTVYTGNSDLEEAKIHERIELTPVSR